MNVILIVVQIVASIGLIGLILMQQGKGADAGASFGAGASQTFFGSAGSANTVTRLTAIFAAIFFVASLSLAYVARQDEQIGLSKELTEKLAPNLPAAADSANSELVPGTQESRSSDADIAPVVPAMDDAPVSEPESVEPADQSK